MPEGPEIRIAADNVAKAIVNQPIREIFFAFEHLKPYEEILSQQLITAVDTKGKGMLIRFTDGLSIYSHNQLYGNPTNLNQATSLSSTSPITVFSLMQVTLSSSV